MLPPPAGAPACIFCHQGPSLVLRKTSSATNPEVRLDKLRAYWCSDAQSLLFATPSFRPPGTGGIWVWVQATAHGKEGGAADTPGRRESLARAHGWWSNEIGKLAARFAELVEPRSNDIFVLRAFSRAVVVEDPSSRHRVFTVETGSRSPTPLRLGAASSHLLP